MPSSKKIHKILVIRLSSIGDVVLASPLIRALRKSFPTAEIHFAVKKEFASLVVYNPHLDKIIQVDSENMEPSISEIAQQGYDWVIDIQQTSRSYQIRTTIKNAHITSFSKQKLKRFLLINLKSNFYGPSITPMYQRYFEAVDKYNVKDDGAGTEVCLTDEIHSNVNSILTKHGIGNEDTLIAVCPGAAFVNKQWTLEGYTEVINNLKSDTANKVVLLGGPNDIGLCEQIENAVDSPVINLAGKLNLLESAAVLKKVKVALTNDSGLMHLAQSQKTAVVATFGPTVKEFGFFPMPERSTVMEVKVSCRPCTKMGLNTCPKGHHHCMKHIDASAVIQALKTYL